MCFHIPTCVGCYSIWRIGHQCNLMRFRLNNQFHKVRSGIPFHIEFSFYNFFQSGDICVTNVTLVGSRVHRNAIGTEAFDVLRCHNDIWCNATSCIPNGGYFINVYAKCDHVFKIGCAKLGNIRIQIHVVERKMNVRLIARQNML